MISYTARIYLECYGSERDLWRADCIQNNESFSQHRLFRSAFDIHNRCNVDALCKLLTKYVPETIEKEFGGSKTILRWFHTLGLRKEELLQIFQSYASAIEPGSARAAYFWMEASRTFLQSGLLDDLPQLWSQCNLHVVDILSCIKPHHIKTDATIRPFLESSFFWGMVFEHDPDHFLPAVEEALSLFGSKSSRILKALDGMPVAYADFDHPILKTLCSTHLQGLDSSMSDINYTSLSGLRFVQLHDGVVSCMPEEEFYFSYARLYEYTWLLHGRKASSIEQSFQNMSLTKLKNGDEPYTFYYDLLSETLISRWSADPKQRSPLGSVLSDPTCLGLWAVRILSIYELDHAAWENVISTFLSSGISDHPFTVDCFDPMEFITVLAQQIDPALSRKDIEHELNLANCLGVYETGIWLSRALGAYSGESLDALEIP